MKNTEFETYLLEQGAPAPIASDAAGMASGLTGGIIHPGNLIQCVSRGTGHAGVPTHGVTVDTGTWEIRTW
jgi:hypothetical protein